MMERIRVLVADDNGVYGGLLSRFLTSQPDMTVVGVASGGREAVSMADSLEPEVVLMDLSMPDVDGFEATRLLGATHPTMKVIAISAQRSDDNGRRSLEAGAAAFVPKDRIDTDLVGTIRDLTGTGWQDDTGSSADGSRGPTASG